MSRIQVYSEWAPLQEVIVGDASSMYFPEPNQYILGEGYPWLLRAVDRLIGTLCAGRRVPEWVRRKYARELERLVAVLEERGIRVHRPRPILPAADEPPGLVQVFARDPIIAVGETILEARQQIVAMRKEIRGLRPLLRELESAGTCIAALPRGDNEVYLEGGDVLVDLPHCFVGVGRHASNMRGVEWLRNQLGPKVSVVPVHVSLPGMVHLDTCMTLIGPHRGIICREAVEQPLPPPLDSYDFVEVDVATCREAGVNVLVLDPTTIVAQARHRNLRKALEQRGYTVIALDFGWHALSVGGFRCATHPLRRGDPKGKTRLGIGVGMRHRASLS